MKEKENGKVYTLFYSWINWAVDGFTQINDPIQIPNQTNLLDIN